MALAQYRFQTGGKNSAHSVDHDSTTTTTTPGNALGVGAKRVYVIKCQPKVGNDRLFLQLPLMN